MPKEEYITVKEYMKRFKLGYESVMNMIKTNQVDHIETSGGKYRIRVGGDTVSREVYEDEKRRRIEAENTLSNLASILESSHILNKKY